jgi:hypothetical protein
MAGETRVIPEGAIDALMIHRGWKLLVIILN